MSQETILAVFATDAWHTYDSHKLIGVAVHLKAAIRCINAEQKARGHKAISNEQEDLIYRIKQTQSDDHIDGEYLVEEVKVWGYGIPQSTARRVVMGESTRHPDRFKRGEKVEP